MRAARLGLVLLALALMARPAVAEDKAAAKQAYIEGRKFFDLNQFPEALEAFKRAYWNYEDPVFLYNIAQVHRVLKHKAEAIDFYKSYLRKAPGTRNREDVQKIIADLEAAIAQEKELASAPPLGTIANEARPAPVVAESPAAAPAATMTVTASAPAKKPVWKRAWVWGVVAGVVVVGVGVGLGVGLGIQHGAPTATDGTVRF